MLKKAMCLCVTLTIFVLLLTGCSLLDKGLKALPYSFVATSEDAAVDAMKKVVKAFKYYTIVSEKADYSWAGDSDTTEDGVIVAFTDCDVTVKNKKDTFTLGVNVCYKDDSDEANEGVWCIYLQNEKLEPIKESEIDPNEPNYGIYLNR